MQHAVHQLGAPVAEQTQAAWDAGMQPALCSFSAPPSFARRLRKLRVWREPCQLSRFGLRRVRLTFCLQGSDESDSHRHGYIGEEAQEDLLERTPLQVVEAEVQVRQVGEEEDDASHSSSNMGCKRRGQ